MASKPIVMSYNWFIMVLGFFVPTLVIMATNGFVVAKLQAVRYNINASNSSYHMTNLIFPIHTI